MTILHLSKPPTASHCAQVIADSQTAIRLHPENMKAYYQLAQAQIALHEESEALESAQTAHRLCVVECRKVPMGKGSSSIGPITELVLRCKRERWEARETRRLRERGGLVEELVGDLEGRKRAAVERELAALVMEEDEQTQASKDSRVESITRAYDGKINELRNVFEAARGANDEGTRRQVPEWCIDEISFSVMLDPVIVSTHPHSNSQTYNIALTMTDENRQIL